MRISEKPENIHKFNKEIEKEFPCCKVQFCNFTARGRSGKGKKKVQ
jgi:hypothetical protein